MDTSALFVQQLSNYAVALQELTFNSKPIINNLTITAGESKSCAEAIARLIEQRIATAGAGQRLPLLYLLDSICKNIGVPYVGHFAGNLAATFLSTYAAVDGQQRSAMMHLLRTWPPVFGADAVARITAEAAAIDAQEGLVTVPKSSAELQLSNPATAPPPRPTSAAVDRVAQLLAKSRSLAVPAPVQSLPAVQQPQSFAAAPYQAPPLTQAQPLPQGPATQVDLTSLLGQLASVVGGMQSSAQQLNPPAQNFTPFPSQSLPQASPYYQGGNLAPHVAPYQAPQAQFFPPTHSQPPPHFQGGPQFSGPPQMRGRDMGGPPQSHGTFPPPHHRGYGGYPPQRERQQPPPQFSGRHGNPAGASRVPSVHFDSEVMKVRHRSVIDALYGDLKVQCKSCGLRFSDQSKMEPHMDWHFKRNRREKTKLKKPISRSWFLETHEWNAFEGREIFTQTAPFFEGAVRKEDDEEECVVRADDSQPACGMCSEEFEKFWDSDQEDWMYRDARRDEGGHTLVHPHCLLAAGEQVRSPASDDGSKSPTAELTLDAFKEQQFSPPMVDPEDEHVVPSSLSPSPHSSLASAPAVAGETPVENVTAKKMTGTITNGTASADLKGDTVAIPPQELESIVGSKRTAADALGSAGDVKRRRQDDNPPAQ